jgi:3-oxoadipate enol-lactonase
MRAATATHPAKARQRRLAAQDLRLPITSASRAISSASPPEGLASRWRAIAGMIRSLVLADTFAKPVAGSKERVEATAEAIAYVSMEEFGTQYAAETLLPSTSLDVQDELTGVIAKVNPKIYIQLMRSAVLGDFAALLAAVKAPTLVLIGANDTIAPRSESEFLIQHIPGATLEVIPAAGHLACLDNPTAFNDAVGRFIDAHR